MEVEEISEASPLMSMIEETHSNSTTPLIIQACAEGDVDRLQRLLACGFDPNITDHRGRNAAHMASCRGSAECLRILDEFGCDVTAADNLGNTPLHLCGHIETVNFLSEHGVQVNQINKHGQTPLMMAERRGVDREVLALLCKLTKRTGKRGAAMLLGRMQGKFVPSRGSASLLASDSTVTQSAMIVAKNVWWEFVDGLGFRKLVILMFGIAMLSLYIACASSGIIPLVMKS
ncbi:ankyrin repeat domain-containing protein 46-like [Ptychodera flava]|uniref:ankyrin repeat domain-containing protein 46-like n=1 Tax=Ptychodera flava TaxID=63121 RepID=UPI00396A70A3